MADVPYHELLTAKDDAGLRCVPEEFRREFYRLALEEHYRVKRLRDALLRVRRLCPHRSIRHTPDAAGGYDSFDTCLDCGKQAKSLETRACVHANLIYEPQLCDNINPYRCPDCQQTWRRDPTCGW